MSSSDNNEEPDHETRKAAEFKEKMNKNFDAMRRLEIEVEGSLSRAETQNSKFLLFSNAGGLALSTALIGQGAPIDLVFSGYWFVAGIGIFGANTLVQVLLTRTLSNGLKRSHFALERAIDSLPEKVDRKTEHQMRDRSFVKYGHAAQIIQDLSSFLSFLALITGALNALEVMRTWDI